jgi:hypothetical protein
MQKHALFKDGMVIFKKDDVKYRRVLFVFAEHLAEHGRLREAGICNSQQY